MSDHSELGLRHFQALCGEALLSKKRIFERAAEVMGITLELQSEPIYRALLAREKLGSTAIGEGVAIPHCRVDLCTQAVGCLLTLADPIDFSALDDHPVDIVFILLVPREATQAHLDLLSRLATLFSNSDMRAALRAAKTTEALQQLLLCGNTA